MDDSYCPTEWSQVKSGQVIYYQAHPDVEVLDGPVIVIDPDAHLVENEPRGHRKTLLPHQPLYWKRGPLVVIRVIYDAAVLAVYSDVDLDVVLWEEERARPYTATAPRQLSGLPENIQRSFRSRRGRKWLEAEAQYSVHTTPPPVRLEKTIRVKGSHTVAAVAAMLAREQIPFSMSPGGLFTMAEEFDVISCFTIPRDTVPQFLQMVQTVAEAGLVDVLQ